MQQPFPLAFQHKPPFPTPYPINHQPQFPMQQRQLMPKPFPLMQTPYPINHQPMSFPIHHKPPFPINLQPQFQPIPLPQFQSHPPPQFQSHQQPQFQSHPQPIFQAIPQPLPQPNFQVQIQVEERQLDALQIDQAKRQKEQQVLTHQLEQKAVQQRLWAEKQKLQQAELEKMLNPEEVPFVFPKEVEDDASFADLPMNLQFLAKVLGPEAFEESKKKALALASLSKEKANKEKEKEKEREREREKEMEMEMEREREKDKELLKKETQLKKVRSNSSINNDKSSQKHNSDITNSLTPKQKHFRTLVAEEIVKLVAKYRKKGELADKEAFKNQCRSFTLKVVEAEIKHDGELEINEKIRARMNSMVDSYFLKHGVTNKK
jgi:hypothetical protein